MSGNVIKIFVTLQEKWKWKKRARKHRKNELFCFQDYIQKCIRIYAVKSDIKLRGRSLMMLQKKINFWGVTEPWQGTSPPPLRYLTSQKIFPLYANARHFHQRFLLRRVSLTIETYSQLKKKVIMTVKLGMFVASPASREGKIEKCRESGKSSFRWRAKHKFE